MEFYNFILTWVMLAGTTLEANDRFLGSVGVALRDRGPLVTNQMNWYHSFVIVMPDTVPLICVSERNAQMEKFCKKKKKQTKTPKKQTATSFIQKDAPTSRSKVS